MQDNSNFDSIKNSNFNSMDLPTFSNIHGGIVNENTEDKETNPWLNWSCSDDEDEDLEYDESELASMENESTTRDEYQQPLKANSWDLVTNEIIAMSPRIHNRLNLLDKLPLLTVTGTKVGPVCEVERADEYIIFKIFETFSTHGKALA